MSIMAYFKILSRDEERQSGYPLNTIRNEDLSNTKQQSQSLQRNGQECCLDCEKVRT